MAKVLGSFSITSEADGYVLHLEDEDGETLEFSATLEQLDEITEAIEDQLELEDEADELPLDEDDEEELPDEN
ncbi:hypothetical protein SAMN06297144_2413 [Sphingomonas guangdongensis]|uniref:DUF1292 domain-containing protein n=1 Tax=Sphingomonas guangdongensis TaxID=1141890 RepID=A0A285QZE6_9SPHN|nr:hypothetical protein [Sphingomonas guangdongensis]SOB87285.1 hypothetical protein SAMN06297144_2413 [Sphingomonas guangdongensis]